ncbi:MAG: hypothetical protein ACLFUB_04020 [Cyclobacteriaceae bacterium]
MQALSSKKIQVKESKHAKLLKVENQPVLIIEATSGFIPFEDFKLLFAEVGEIVKGMKITKLIFDKRQLTVFHQPSMQWYFTEWKEDMYKLGLMTHRKILPKDDLFRHSVKVGREKISDQFPKAVFHKLDIQYAETVEEAIAR